MVGAFVLTAIALALYGWRLRAPASGATQIARYRAAMRRSLTAFGFGGIMLLALAGQIEALWRFPAEFAPAATWLDRLFGPVEGDTLTLALLLGFAGGVLVGAAISWRRRRKGRGDFMIGDIAHLIPREPGAFRHAASLSLVAAGCEELFFRLVLPLLIARATGEPLAGFAAATLLFAFAHRYQRWTGVLATLIGGLFLALVYVRSGALWVPVATHAAINLNGLVIRPWLARRFSPSAGIRS